MSTRAERVSEGLAARELDALLVTNLPNLRWLTGFTGSNGACLVGADVRLLFTDFRYTEQAQAQAPDFEVVQSGRDLLGDVARRMQGRVGFEDAFMSVRTHTRLGEAAAQAELVPASGAVEALRAVKDEGEIAAMRAAMELSDRALQELAETGIAGRTEKRIAFDLETRMRVLGADDRSFAPIVASGAQGARPHALSRDLPVERDTLMVVDLGCMLDGYCSDCTRTFATGSLSDEAIEIYELVARAQLAGLDAVRAGVACRDADAAARAVIEAAGHGEHFGHPLGHGVGIEVHEDPRLAPTSEGTLVSGNAVTVEPGVYVPGSLGVRIEDLVVVTDSGCDILPGFSKELITLA